MPVIALGMQGVEQKLCLVDVLKNLGQEIFDEVFTDQGCG
jgi:hypothetical protein